jgi:hypothetical protein
MAESRVAGAAGAMVVITLTVVTMRGMPTEAIAVTAEMAVDMEAIPAEVMVVVVEMEEAAVAEVVVAVAAVAEEVSCCVGLVSTKDSPSPWAIHRQ